MEHETWVYKGRGLQPESYRDSISTVDREGKRVWVYPKKPKGKFTTYRNWVSLALLAILFAGPFVRVGGQPLLLLNILERKFIIFGQVFWPQDFYLFVLASLIGLIFIVLFTVVYGRVFCGWICPQTIFMEGVFRKIEYWIEGDYTAQKKLDKQAWNREKVLKKSSKHLVFFAISFLIANTFLAYIIGSEELLDIVTDPPQEHLAGLISILIFTAVFYWVFARFREQVCTTVCPYGRLQGVMLDKDSVVISYDYTRGESRAKYRKGEDRKAADKGDCVDCKLCVSVCPTGIDIRNGTQLECINCTACIDACDSIMDNVGLPRGLIRYESEANLQAGRTGMHWTKRSIAYTAVLAVLMVAFFGLLFMRSQVETSLLRTPGMLYQEQEGGLISNLYNYKIINKTHEGVPVTFRLLEGEGEIKLIGNQGQIQVPEGGTAEGALFILIPKTDIRKASQKLKIGVFQGDQQLETLKTKFMGPISGSNGSK
ncbi:cytochrome c oxidase accessory protein CcoG [Cesiribacter andamanensis]|nr:cytochrome c oxidase accessory protein CcoG [Cesiribacter andamanensis]